MFCKVLISMALAVIFSFHSNFAPVAVATATVPDPTEQLRPFVDKIVTILTDVKLQGDEKCTERRQQVMKIAHERFDFFEMSKRVLGSQWRKLSENEQQEFADLFTTLLEHAYIGKIEDYSKQKVEFKDQRIKDDRAEVRTDLIDKDVVIPVSYIMILKNQDWMVYDIIVEGVSLVRNYMEQFKEILRKDGYASLLAQLKDKVDELEKATKPCPVDITPRES
jgi:phospholipid transport system substrate-binding protein